MEKIKEGTYRKLADMPYDTGINTEYGFALCHAIGYEVYLDGEWWNEYQSPDGEYHYRR